VRVVLWYLFFLVELRSLGGDALRKCTNLCHLCASHNALSFCVSSLDLVDEWISSYEVVLHPVPEVVVHTF